MSKERDFIGQSLADLVMLIAQGDKSAKTEFARRLLFGDGVDKDEAKAVSLLDDCVAHGNADAMVILAKCNAFGQGMEHNAERAEALLSDAAKKGNDKARILMQLINDWKGKEFIDFESLRNCLLNKHKWIIHVCIVSAERLKEDCAIERVTLVMNIVPCRDLGLSGQT